MGYIQIEYGDEFFTVAVPIPLDEKGMVPVPTLADPFKAIKNSFEHPIESPPLREIVRSKIRRNPDAQAVIVVSDNTRPVPYKGRGGIIAPLLRTLIESGLKEDRIIVLIGCGSHRNMQQCEIEAMLGLNEAGFNVSVVNHEYDDEKTLVFVGRTKRGSPVKINRLYCKSDIKIVTGLVESHFMAGVSGGRKAICPGVAGKETLQLFHGPEILNSPNTADLVLDGNPCHEEALQAAHLAGSDFSVNVTIDAERRCTGVFSGDLEAAHNRAVGKILEYVVIALEKRYDLVIIPAGFVGVNHYQAAKAAIEASRAVRPGGMIILVAQHRDPDPVGSSEYRKTLAMLKKHGPEKFLQIIMSPEWTFLHDQWETQMWGKVIQSIGSELNLLYCACEIPREDYCIIPCKSGFEFYHESEFQNEQGSKQIVKAMTSRAICFAIEKLRAEMGRDPGVLFLRDGPYGVPMVTEMMNEKKAYVKRRNA
jgi:nickel-dependent lactate racemase